MPLTNSVTFKAAIGKGNRIQIPTLIRWEFKLEPTQLLTVSIRLFERGIQETFYTKMNNTINNAILQYALFRSTTMPADAYDCSFMRIEVGAGAIDQMWLWLCSHRILKACFSKNKKKVF